MAEAIPFENRKGKIKYQAMTDQGKVLCTDMYGNLVWITSEVTRKGYDPHLMGKLRALWWAWKKERQDNRQYEKEEDAKSFKRMDEV